MDIAALENAGLKSNEAKIYITLLENGISLVSDLYKKIAVHRRNIYDALEKLQEKGLVTVVIKKGKKHFEAVNPEKLLDYLQEKEEGIKQVLPVKRENEFIIITAGSNLKEILKMKEVDVTRTISNDIYEITEVLGIEAARQAIINEVFKVIEAQGLNVDIRHIMLVADTMCVTGDIKGITRYGVVSEKASVLARASFETPIKHIINAALIGEVDRLDSVVENVMLNQPIPVGTGLPGLITKVKK